MNPALTYVDILKEVHASGGWVYRPRFVEICDPFFRQTGNWARNYGAWISLEFDRILHLIPACNPCADIIAITNVGRAAIGLGEFDPEENDPESKKLNEWCVMENCETFDEFINRKMADENE